MMITKDYFYKGKIIVNQHKKGYRFSIDAPILADFLPAAPKEKALEIGTGSGIVSLLALYKRKYSHINGLEIQKPLGELAKLNVLENGFQRNFSITVADFNRIYREYAGIRHVFSNPPFYAFNCGRLSPNLEIRDAKVETKLTLSNLVEKTFSILGEAGNLSLILPYSRYPELIKLVNGIGGFISRQRFILSFSHGKPERFLIQLTNYKVSPVTLPPLIIFKEKGVYMEEMDGILNG